MFELITTSVFLFLFGYLGFFIYQVTEPGRQKRREEREKQEFRATQSTAATKNPRHESTMHMAAAAKIREMIAQATRQGVNAGGAAYHLENDIPRAAYHINMVRQFDPTATTPAIDNPDYLYTVDQLAAELLYLEAWLGRTAAPETHHTFMNPEGRFRHNPEKLKTALEAITKCLNYRPTNTLFWREKALIYLAMERKQDALACYNKALEIDPNDVESFQARELMYQ